MYVFNTSGPSYQIIPVINKVTCFETPSEQLQHVFPDLAQFTAQHGVFLVGGRACYAWKFTTSGSGPTPDGLLGEYTLYVDAKTNAPVRFHYVGRNGMLGGSHIDEYFLDYAYVREGPVADQVFRTLPSLMNCSNLSDYHGPSRAPAQDVRSPFRPRVF